MGKTLFIFIFLFNAPVFAADIDCLHANYIEKESSIADCVKSISKNSFFSCNFKGDDCFIIEIKDGRGSKL